MSRIPVKHVSFPGGHVSFPGRTCLKSRYEGMSRFPVFHVSNPGSGSSTTIGAPLGSRLVKELGCGGKERRIPEFFRSCIAKNAKRWASLLRGRSESVGGAKELAAPVLSDKKDLPADSGRPQMRLKFSHWHKEDPVRRRSEVFAKILMPNLRPASEGPNGPWRVGLIPGGPLPLPTPNSSVPGP